MTDPATGTSALNIPIDVVSSVHVLSTPDDPEYGKFTGAVSNVETRPGSFNKFRISVQNLLPRLRRVDGSIIGKFVELTQGSDTSPAYHGQATLSRWKISNSRIIRFREQSNFWKPRWYIPKLEPFQERLGGRIALVSEINISGVSIASYNLHLESRANDELRLAQLDEVLRDARAYKSVHLTIIAGDLNLNASDPATAEAIARAGFTDAVPTSLLATTPGRHLLDPGRHIDWAFVRGPAQIDTGRIHDSIKASDHYPISFEIGLSSGH